MKTRLLAIFSAIVGVGLFVYVIRQTGVSEIWANVRGLGAGFLLILAISSSRYLSRTLAWLRCMAPEERGVGFGALWRARLAGEAVGDLTFGPVVAEPLRLVALGDKVSLASGVSSLTVENIAYTVSSCMMVMAGAAALLAGFGLQGSARAAMLGALLTVTAVVFASILFINRRWAVGSRVADALNRGLIRDAELRRKLDGHIRHLRELEEYVFDFYSRRPLDFLFVGLCEAAFHAGGVLEIYATLHLLGVDATLSTAFLLESVNRAINIAFIFVPALVGVDEALTKLLTETLHLGGTTGVTLAIIRKIRMFFWIAIGLLFLLASRKRTMNDE
ncbi:MAG: lysylphosphatidylglycerol synthase domain-containing protein [Blastocatellia bacterium]|nr:lysylphosphatidylglycerol synthase domain-containing protein [Blastocatellia bacterium]